MTPGTEPSARILTPDLVLLAVVGPHGADQPVVVADLPELTHELNPIGPAGPVLATASHEWFEGTVDGVLREHNSETAEGQRGCLEAYVVEMGEPTEILMSWDEYLCQAYISYLSIEHDAAGLSVRFSFLALARHSETSA